jgi:hypothetical protein
MTLASARPTNWFKKSISNCDLLPLNFRTHEPTPVALVIFDLLLRYHPELDVNATNSLALQPLHIALQWEDSSVAIKLVELGADVCAREIPDNVSTRQVLDPLATAIYWNNAKLISVLAAHPNVDLSTVSPPGLKQNYLHQVVQSGGTASRIALIKVLLQRGCSGLFDEKDLMGRMAFEYVRPGELPQQPPQFYLRAMLSSISSLLD